MTGWYELSSLCQCHGQDSLLKRVQRLRTTPVHFSGSPELRNVDVFHPLSHDRVPVPEALRGRGCAFVCLINKNS